ncbi:MAG: hypothetical protein M1608_16690 [Candidatus Omnitrophica bacterium]|nr:hypothetical protein [Candidatus Omnitrophota bacterium]
MDPNQFLALTRQGPLYTKTVQTFFHTLGFVNSSSNPKESPRNFLPNLNASQVGQIPSGTAGMVDSFIVPVKGPSDIIEYNANGKRTGRLLNTWRYVSSSPTNNPGSFDLWAEIVIGRETKIIGNWKE